ncbi:MAG: TetR/AcrR family transcriptional regulator [Aquabacterium sp.]
MPRPAPSGKPTAVRRVPAQRRALQTQALIFEAAIRLLESDGLDGFSTNRLALESGYAVGTIYQYFGSKRELLAALARREVEQAIAATRRSLAAQATGSGAAAAPLDRIRAGVRLLLGAFGGRLKARRVLVQAALASGQTEELDRPARAVAALLVGQGLPRADGSLLRLDDHEAFVLTQALMGAVRSALLTEPARLKQPAFEDALVRLVAGFLGVDGDRGRRR